jgi:cytochrome o ubiquinol oxidase operon protein cyoD
MNKDSLQRDIGYGTLSSYVFGFLCSLLLTITAYLLVIYHVFSNRLLIAAIISLAVVQFSVQLIFFLHLDRSSKPRWNLLVSLFAFIVLTILVLGSLWIMSHLNYNMMTPQETNTYILNDERIHK